MQAAEREEEEKRTRMNTAAATMGQPTPATGPTMGSSGKPGAVSGTRRKVVERGVADPSMDRGLSGSDRM